MNNCLSYQQLQDYSLQRLRGTERDLIYMHLSTCELCAGAVNGFAAQPFSSDELVAIHRRIDQKVNATAASPLTIAPFFIVLISLLSIAGVYMVADQIGEQRVDALVPLQQDSFPAMIKSEAPVTNIVSPPMPHKKVLSFFHKPRFRESLGKQPIPESLDPIKAIELPSTYAVVESAFTHLKLPTTSSDIIYIYDLKVADYSHLYFGKPAREESWNKNHVPVNRENKWAEKEEADLEMNNEPSDKVLKHGLFELSKQEYSEALGAFNTLLEKNQEDVNALFYSALCYHAIGQEEMAQQRLQHLRTNNDRSFAPEADWQLALVYLKRGDKQSAKELLHQIQSENGFYAKKAQEKLKGL